jgi:hypothetical protein
MQGRKDHSNRCYRKCVTGTEPMTCYYRWFIEDYSTLGAWVTSSRLLMCLSVRPMLYNTFFHDFYLHKNDYRTQNTNKITGTRLEMAIFQNDFFFVMFHVLLVLYVHTYLLLHLYGKKECQNNSIAYLFTICRVLRNWWLFTFSPSRLHVTSLFRDRSLPPYSPPLYKWNSTQT